MSLGGSGISRHNRADAETRLRYDRLLSERHLSWWGDNCPAVDLDFLMAEFNHGVPVAIVDYKWFGADLKRTNERTFEVLGGFYNLHGDQIPFIVARYWPDTWAFKVLPVNAAAQGWYLDRHDVSHDATGGWLALSEREYVESLYALRGDVLTRGDRRYIERLNTTPPPPETGAA
jgi:hypothetical protein